MKDWKDLLIKQGDHKVDNQADFPHADLNSEHNYLVAIQHQGLISIQGPEAAKFLQGQVTCDVHELSDNRTLLGAHCNNKGRMLLLFRALQPQTEQIVLRVDSSLLSQGIASLSKYVVFSKARIADITGDYRLIGISGPLAEAILKTTLGLGDLPIDNWQAFDSGYVVRLDSTRFEVWITATTAETLWARLATKCTPTNISLWQLLDIQAGLGAITADTFENFTPQALNLQLINGINFRKGCYTGQEIVARLHYKATLKKHMYRFEFDLNGAALPTPGTSIINGSDGNQGEVVIAAIKSTCVGELLAHVNDDSLNDAYISINRQKLRRLPLPYAIPNLNETP